MFAELKLPPALLSAIKTLGYKNPTPIQQKGIPVLMEGGDLLAQAQTGTGKTTTFALPILSHVDLGVKSPQALIIAPTRELAIQVSQSFKNYGKDLNKLRVTTIYGGQDFKVQQNALKQGVHIVVGTPGRIMDHLRRKTLQLDSIKTVVLDEADEMLRMGFIDDVEWILGNMKHKHQTALFSATFPKSIAQIANRYLKDAQRVVIKPEKNAVETIQQFCMCVPRHQKIDALVHYLGSQDVQAAIVFARTKDSTTEIADKLKENGFLAGALNGDLSQRMRERVMNQIKQGTLNIIVATDIAARGLDIEHINHVINFDVPYDPESYVHRIGRTGRAGRMGKAVLFFEPREQRLVRSIERFTGKTIKPIQPPTASETNEHKRKQLAEKIQNILQKSKKVGSYRQWIEDITDQFACDSKDIAAALAYLLSQPSLPEKKQMKEERFDRKKKPKFHKKGQKRHGSRSESEHSRKRVNHKKRSRT